MIRYLLSAITVLFFYGTVNPVQALELRPQDFGAKANGINDDTRYCQTALDAKVKTVLFDGTFRITSPLLLPSNITIIFAPNSKFIFDLPNSISWDDAKTGRFSGASCFINRAGFAEYKKRAVTGKLVDHWKRIKPTDNNIHFKGHAEFTTTTLNEKKHTGAWVAISLLYVDSFSIESLHTNVLNGVYFFECSNGVIGNLSGNNIRNYGIVGGVALVGFICDNLSFKSIKGWRNFSTFVIDGGAATNIVVQSLYAGDADTPDHADWPPVSLRHVELTGCNNVQLNNVELNGGGLYQSLMLNSLAQYNTIKGTIKNSYKESVRIQNASSNNLDLTITNPWTSRDGGYSIGLNGLLGTTKTDKSRPVIYLHNVRNRAPTKNNRFLIEIVEKKGNANRVIAESLDNVDQTPDLEGNSFTVNSKVSEPYLQDIIIK